MVEVGERNNARIGYPEKRIKERKKGKCEVNLTHLNNELGSEMLRNFLEME